MKQFPLGGKKKPKKWQRYLFKQANETETTLKQVEKVETQSHCKTHPRHSNPQSGRNSKPRASP